MTWAGKVRRGEAGLSRHELSGSFNVADAKPESTTSAVIEPPVQSSPGPTPIAARLWGVWRPVWRRRVVADGWAFPALLLFWVLLLISPYLAINRMAAWSPHTPLSAELREQRKTLKISQQDERTVWDPKSMFRDTQGRYWDYRIPFVDWSLLFYLSLFAYYPCFYAAPRTDRGRVESLLLAQAWVLSSWIAYPIFALFPAHIDLRWQLVDAGGLEGPFGWLYRMFHTLDEPFNAWPCLHIAQSFIIATALARWWMRRGRRWAVALLWPMWIGLFLSVLTTKQHFLWDALTGVLLGIGIWRLWLRPAWRYVDWLEDDRLPLANLEKHLCRDRLTGNR